MLVGMRSPVLALLLTAAACRASATVERTMPVANLQTFRTIAVRVHSSTFASQGTTMALEQQVLQRLGRACQFDQVERANGQPADILLDLTIVASGRGGGGFITNNNVATVDTQLVLTDTHDNQLLGTAKIRGKSGGVLINNNIPEFDAVDKVAEATANLLAKSGCSGPRIARVETPPPPPDTGSGSDTQTTDTGTDTGSEAPPPNAHLAEAEAINDQGKEKLYAGDLQGALALFQRANSTAPDARFAFNVCIVQIQLEQWAAANASCQQAKSLNPPATLATKIDNRIEQLAQRK
jgi:hypothetical protein